MYNSIVMSTLVLLLSGAFIICTVGTVAPLFLNESNIDELWPILFNALKISIVLTLISGAMDLFSPGALFHNFSLEATIGGMLVWSLIIMVASKAKKRSLDRQAATSPQ